MQAPIFFDRQKAQHTIEYWKDNGLHVVFTNGCFDLIHAGHIQYLNNAKELGDKLIVGLNSDQSIKKLKGKNRPIHSFDDRAALLSYLNMVDMVILFEEDTPLELIKIVRPDILVKGGDYTVQNIVGAEYVKLEGGSVYVVPFKDGYSSSMIIDKIKKS